MTTFHPAIGDEVCARVRYCADAQYETSAQPGLLRILRGVAPKVVQLRLASHDVIERLALPQSAFSSEKPIDVERAPAFPVANNRTQRDSLPRLDQNVDMIRHDDPCVQMIGFSVAGDETRREQFGALRARQQAFAVAGVKQLVKVVKRLW
jgi:hypothetical protein